MKVSWIVPCWNGEKYLQSFLDCVAAQTWRPLELIFVDDGSTDNTSAIFSQMQPVLEGAGITAIYCAVPHGGQAAAMNAGLARMTGDFLTWSDADDFLLPRAVEAKVRFLLDNPDYAMVRHDAWNYEDGILKGRVCRPEHIGLEDVFSSLFRETLYCYAGCYMMRKELFYASYPDGQIPVSQEGQNLQMLLPPASRTRCGWLDEALMIYRIHHSSHAHHQRSLPEMVARAQEFYKLRLQLLPFCQCDQDTYRKEAEQIFNQFKKNMLKQASYLYKAKKIQEKQI